MDVLFATAVGAFFGTLAALVIQWLKQQRDEVLLEVSRGNKVLVGLAEELQELYRLRGQFLSPARNREDRHLRLNRFHAPAFEGAIHLQDLVFLTKSPNPVPGLIKEVLEAKKAAQAARSQLAERNNHHAELVRRHGEEIERGNPRSEDHIVQLFRQAIGPLQEAVLRSHTENLYGATDEAVEIVGAAFANLRRVLQSRYPGYEFVRIEIDGAGARG